MCEELTSSSCCVLSIQLFVLLIFICQQGGMAVSAFPLQVYLLIVHFHFLQFTGSQTALFPSSDKQNLFWTTSSWWSFTKCCFWLQEKLSAIYDLFVVGSKHQIEPYGDQDCMLGSVLC